MKTSTQSIHLRALLKFLSGKHKYLLVSYMAMLFITGCKDSDDLSETIQGKFVVSVGDGYISDDYNYWLSLYDTAGNSLTDIELNNGNTYTVDLEDYNSPEQLIVQIIVLRESSSPYTDMIYYLYDIKTYLDVTPGKWILADNYNTTQIGTETINISTDHFPDRISVTNKKSTDYLISRSSTSSTVTLSQYYQSDELFLFVADDEYYDNTYRYKWFSVNETNPVINYSLSSLDQTTNSATFEIAENDFSYATASIYGVTNDYYYILNYNYIYTDSLIELRYPNDIFNKYNTTISYKTNDNYTYTYASYNSTIPTSYETLDFDVSINNSSLTDMDIDYIGTADFLRYGFDNDTNINNNYYAAYYYVYGSPESVSNYKHGKLISSNIDEILNTLLTNELQFSYWAAYDYNNYYSFDDYINSIFILNNNAYEDNDCLMIKGYDSDSYKSLTKKGTNSFKEVNNATDLRSMLFDSN